MNAERLLLQVYADIAGIEVPYPGMKRDACKGKNIVCPISKGQEITLVQGFPVKKFFPSVSNNTRILIFILSSLRNCIKIIFDLL